MLDRVGAITLKLENQINDCIILLLLIVLYLMFAFPNFTSQLMSTIQ